MSMREIAPPPGFDAPVRLAIVEDGEPPPPSANIVMTVRQAEVLLEAPVPELRLLRTRGTVLLESADASRNSRRIHRRIRAYLSPTRPSILAEVAEDHGMADLAEALRTWNRHGSMSFSALADALRPSDPCRPLVAPLHDDARLLLALEHL